MKKILILLIIVGLIIGGVATWWKVGTQAVKPNDKSSQIFVIEKGDGIREIANKLHEAGLIKDPVVFFLIVKKEGFDSKIQAGDFRLSPSQNARDIAETLTHGTLDIWVTVPEGKRAEEVADILEKELPSYEPAWREQLIAEEGYLYPDTYLIPRDATIETIISIMKSNFYNKISEVGLSQDTPNLSEIVTIASLLEREANTDEQKPVIAGIIQNRLNADMPLQIDATIQYAKGKTGEAWWQPITVDEYRSVNSVYNTYLFPGLPPGPISNPGLPSIKAAANPQDTDYVYYLHDRTGQIRYARTINEHNANIERYGL